jgi:hypothetical protein
MCKMVLVSVTLEPFAGFPQLTRSQGGFFLSAPMPATLAELQQRLAAIIDRLQYGDITEDQTVDLAAAEIVKARNRGLFDKPPSTTI